MMKGKLPISFPALSVGKLAAVALCVVAVGTTVATWQGGALFGADFSWTNSSYAIQQAYDSTAFQVEEDAESDNPVSQDDPAEEKSADPGLSASNASGGNAPLSGTVVPSEEEVVIGSGGTASGGNPSQGEGPSGPGSDPEPGPGPGPGPEGPTKPDPEGPEEIPEIIDPGNRFEEMTDPSLDYVDTKPRYTVEEAHLTGRGKTVVRDAALAPEANRVLLNEVTPYLSGYFVIRKEGSAQTERLELKPEDFRFNADEVAQIRPFMKGPFQIKVSYRDSGETSATQTGIEVTCDAYEHRADFTVTNAVGAQITKSVHFNGTQLSIPAEVWELALRDLKEPDGTVSSLFLGWEYDGRVAIDALTVGADVVAFRAMAKGTAPVPAGMRVEARETAQVLTDIDPATPAISGGRLIVPEGVNTISLAGMEPNDSVTTICLPSTITDVDIPSVLRAFPHLSTWEVEGANPYFEATHSGYLASKVSDGGCTIISIPPSSPSVKTMAITVDEGVVGFGPDAFEGIAWDPWGLRLVFAGDAVEIQDWGSLPAEVEVAAPSSINDQAYCRYLSLFSQNRPDLLMAEPVRFWRQDGIYATGIDDDGGAVYFLRDHGAELAYIPDVAVSSYRIPALASRVLTTAFIDCTALTNITIPSTVSSIEAGALMAAGLHSIILEAPDSVTIEAGQKLFSDRASYADDFTLYLACEAGSAAHGQWLDQLASCWGSRDEAAAHIVCIGADEGNLETDEGNGVVYKQDGGTLTLLSVPQGVSVLTVKEGTTAIAADAVRGLPDLRALILPESVTDIPSDAFAGCAKLEAVIFPDALAASAGLSAWAAEVGLTAVDGCSSLGLIGASSEHQWDGVGVFYRRITQGLEAVYALKEVGGLFPDGTITLLSGTTSLAPGLFAGDATACGVAGERLVTQVGARAFEGCTALRSVAVFGEVRSIGAFAFARSGVEGSIALRGARLVMDASAFEDCARLGEVSFSGTVSSLGARAFQGCSSLTRVVFADDLADLAVMGASAFADCPQLSEVAFSAGVRVIAEDAFAGCGGLRTLRFPETGARITSIGERAFSGCVKLETLTLHRLILLQTIGVHAFSCAASTTRAASGGSTGGALKGSIYFPPTLVSIGAGAFADQSSLEKIYLHGDVSSLKTIGAGAFQGCASLYSVALNEATSGLVIGASAFAGDPKLSSVTLPKSLISVGQRAFAQCTSLASLSLKGAAGDPCAWSAIGSEAFYGCGQLQSLDLSSTALKTIPARAFAGCTALSMVILPATIAQIGEGAFSGCVALMLLNILAEEPPTMAQNAFEGCDMAQLIVQVPRSEGDQILHRYQTDPTWLAIVGGSSEQITTPDVSGAIHMGAGEYRRVGAGYALVRVDPGKVTSGFAPAAGTVRIEKGAFKDCRNLLTVVVPTSVSSVAEGAFAGCSALENLVFQGDRPPAFEGDLFAGEAVQDIFRLYVINVNHAPNHFGSLVSLVRFKLVAGGNTFAIEPNTGALYTTYDVATTPVTDVLLRVPRAATGELGSVADTQFVADSAAEGCRGLTRVTLPNTVKSIGAAAFKDSGITVFSGAGELTQIGQSAFEGCTALTQAWFFGGSTNNNVYLPESLRRIGPFAFKGCTSIKTFQMNGQVEEIPEGMLANCTSLTQMSGGSKSILHFKRFGKDLFAGCTAMTTTGASLTAFSSLEEIGEGAYQGCSNLSLAVFPASLQRIGQGAFSGCKSVEFVVFNGASPVSVTGSGLPDVWCSGLVPVFVPQDEGGGMGIAQAYETAWGSDAPPAGVDAVARSYRTASGNLYAELEVHNSKLIDMVFLSTTTQACTNGLVKVFSHNSYDWKTLYINKGALKGKAYVKRFLAGPNCVGIPARPGIGDGAFDGTGGAQGLTLDLSEMSEVPFVGDHIFGAQAPSGTRIIVKDEKMAEEMSATTDSGRLGSKLLEDYGLRLVRDESVTSEVALKLVDAATVVVNDADTEEVEEGILGDAHGDDPGSAPKDTDEIVDEGIMGPNGADGTDDGDGGLSDATEPGESGSATETLGDNEGIAGASLKPVLVAVSLELTEEERP